ncbi:M28 family peptidase [Pseudoflavitalea sp. G-6-1-2]|uniref:M28 family peptidase n=1 Tax=Pseudoflavitalea sp. G-6-1-2 TaxID=2728841 RepID=UPI00197F3101|nr:M28 family peptidase [Pseudoflavitalea sp. G-6-1-2]
MRLLALPLLVLSLSASAQTSPTEKLYSAAARKNFQAANALKTVAFVESRWRLAGNSGFNESIRLVEKQLQQAGYVKDSTGTSGAKLTYRIEHRPMDRLTWEPIDASVFIEGESTPLLSFKTNRNMIAINSESTPEGGVTAELVCISKEEDWNQDLKGKIVYDVTSAGNGYNRANSKGAIGSLSYTMPAYTQPEKNIHSIQFGSIPGKRENIQWHIFLSYAAKSRLNTALAKGSVKLKVMIKTKRYNAEELTVVADVKGSEKPAERFVFSAHVQEPGANDNATGVGTLAEMARVTAAMIKEGKLNPRRSITFLWGDEIVSTRRYIQEDSIRALGIRWGCSLDMVGEDTKKTGGTFLIEKMPDPSAVWTRGKDKHSEWGGSPLPESSIVPHYFNDLLLTRCLNEAADNGWVVKTNPFEGGSDHTPFLNAKIPGLLMWHFTDQFYHTDGDRFDKVSGSTMKHVGVSALVISWLLASADNNVAVALVQDLKRSAVKRLSDEVLIGKANLKKGSIIETEDHILEVWQQYYSNVLDTMKEIPVEGASESLTNAIEQAKKEVNQKKYRLR